MCIEQAQQKQRLQQPVLRQPRRRQPRRQQLRHRQLRRRQLRRQQLRRQQPRRLQLRRPQLRRRQPRRRHQQRLQQPKLLQQRQQHQQHQQPVLLQVSHFSVDSLFSCSSLPTSIFSIINGAGTSTTYQLYTNTFTPTSNVTTITFAFQVDDNPGIWDFDDVSLKQSSGIELMQNGDFESGSISPSWIPSCTAQCTGISGQGSGGGPGSISTVYPHGGTYNYRDRCNPEPKFDYLSQTISPIVPNQLCTLKYYLALTYVSGKTHNNFYVIIS
ncbi:unnamed protein product [Rotaria sp. Silwood2]|nr:unnamed protein product [Rotaria sp. Silwood2]CAF3920724.1 unnamed protein product [Rotaria sp. Silwood2]